MATHVATAPEVKSVSMVKRQTVPLWLAVTITVMVSLPFDIIPKEIWGAKFALPVWAAFVVWAEYFALGAKPAAIRIILPSFILSTLGMAACMTTMVLIHQYIGLDTNWSLTVALFIWASVLVYIMKFSPTLEKGALPYFNGISMLLAVYFTGSYPTVSDPLLQPWMAALWVILAAILGVALGWFSETITFTHEVPESKS